MRQYDKISGTRFDMNHPIWKSGMLTKAGKVRSRMDWKNAKELMEKGLIDLRPSVTEIAKVGDGFGIFGPASQWGVDMTITALEEWMSKPENGPGGMFELIPSQIKGMAQALMAKPRDTGSELHDAYHEISTGRLTPRNATEAQNKFYNACGFALRDIGIGTDFETEVQFVNDVFGGTCDLDAGQAGVDWKTVAKFRQPRTSELLQLGAYADHFGWEEAYIVYVHQTSFEYKILKFTQGGGETSVSLAQCIPTFYQAVGLWNGINDINVPKVA